MAAESVDCPVCGMPSDLRTSGLYDDRYGYPGIYSLWRCRSCRHVFLGQWFSPDELAQLYNDWYPRASATFDEQTPLAERKGLRAWLAGHRSSAVFWVPPAVKVLDIGCSFGLTLAYHQRRRCDAYGVEPDEHAAKEGQRQGLKIDVGLFDPDRYDAGSFDYVTLDQVLEHVISPRETLEGISRVLKPGGVAIIATPNSHGYAARVFGRFWINWHAPYHLQFYSKRSLDLLAREAGLRLLSQRTLTASAWLEYQFLHLFTRPRMGTPSPFWDPGRSHGNVPGLVAYFAAILRRVHVFDLVTRIADGLGLGDNRLIFMEKPADGGSFRSATDPTVVLPRQ